jgi:hypothetical protein
MQQPDQHQPHDPDDHVGLAVVDRQLGAVAARRSDGRQTARDRTTHVAAEAARPGHLHHAAQRRWNARNVVAR